MQRIKILSKTLLSLFAISILLVSCSKEDASILSPEDDTPSITGSSSGTRITFSAYRPENDDQTKTSLGGDNKNIVYWHTNEKINVFYNKHSYKFISTNTAQTSSKIDFDGNIQNLTSSSDVIALYPYDKKATIDASGVVTTTLPAYQVAQEGTFADSLSISLAKGTMNVGTATGQLMFYNVCSGLCFSVTKSGIKSVELESKGGELLAGTFTVKFVDQSSGDPLPIVQSVVEGSSVVTVVAPNGEFEVGKQYYIVTLPQTCATGILITGFVESGEGYEFELSSSVTFNRAKFKRKLNFDSGATLQDLYDYTLSAVGPDAFMYASGERDYKVTSYRTRKGTSRVTPMAWKVQVSTDGGTTYQDLTNDNKTALGVDWLTFSPLGAINSSEDAENFKVSATTNDNIIAQEDAETAHNNVLKSNTGLSIYGVDNSTYANAIDLSYRDVDGNNLGSMNTANCYVVRAPGWYKFPVVFGNAIKNGAENTDAYAGLSDSEESGTLLWFADEEGSEIGKSPNSVWISLRYDHVQKPALVWQDVENLVSNISITGDDATKEKKYIYFYVDPANIKQGNAVISVNHWSRIAWSWHIWVTDLDISNTSRVTNAAGNKHDLMNYNLGWCVVGDRITYGPREAKVRIAQVVGGQTVSFTITQEGKTVEPSGNNPYYQWGRKDPQLPSTGFGDEDKPFFGSWSIGSQTERIKYKNAVPTSDRQKLAALIQHPDIYDIYQEGIYDESWNLIATGSVISRYANLWDGYSHRSNKTGVNVIEGSPSKNYVVKTVYDPSPYGFTVAASAAFTGFSAVGMGGADLQVASGFDNGYYFYKNPNDLSEGTIYFSIAGIRRQSDGLIVAYQEDGYYWTAHSKTHNNGINIQFGSSKSLGLDPNDNYEDGTNYFLIKNNYKGTGYPVRSAVDKSL